MEYSKIKEMADFMSAFTVFRIPVYLVEKVVSGGPAKPLIEFMRKELKPGCEFTPKAIMLKTLELYK